MQAKNIYKLAQRDNEKRFEKCTYVCAKARCKEEEIKCNEKSQQTRETQRNGKCCVETQVVTQEDGFYRYD